MTPFPQTITSPILLLDREKCMANIDRMVNKAERYGLTLKPHFKTHQSTEIARWFRKKGIDSATVSSVKMAEYFADSAWKDLTIAFPVNIREIDRINRLAESVSLSLFVIEKETADFLKDQLKAPVRVYIEIDTGSGRTGLRPDETAKIDSLIGQFKDSGKLRFSGLYSHPGHSYTARSKKEIQSVHENVLSIMQSLKKRFRDAGPIRCCIGDTPCCSVAEDFEGIDEISPGNFVFYDLMQARIGSCDIADIAVALASPVVAKHNSRNEIILHGGAIHLSKDFLAREEGQSFGIPVLLNERGWSEPIPNCYLRALSQEPGVLACSKRFFQSVNVGDIIGILPVHSCLTADLMREYRLHPGGEAVSHMKNGN